VKEVGENKEFVWLFEDRFGIDVLSFVFPLMKSKSGGIEISASPERV
jgi:hypothetical protein